MPDIAAIQECARPTETTDLNESWLGDNPIQGLLVKTSKEFPLSRVEPRSIPAKFFLPVSITRPIKFNVLAVWAKPSQKTPKYVTTLLQGIEAYSSFIDSESTIILGDLNTARYLSAKDSHMQFVNLLRDKHGLISAYHVFNNIEHGHELDSTYFDRSKKNKPFHIDYCFIPEDWASKIAKVEVGSFAVWHDLSDHTPLWVDIEI